MHECMLDEWPKSPYRHGFCQRDMFELHRILPGDRPYIGNSGEPEIIACREFRRRSGSDNSVIEFVEFQASYS